MANPGNPAILEIMSWNLLAYEFTGHESRNHRNELPGQAAPLEHINQFIERCERARHTILARNAAVVLLQEVSFSFLNDLTHGGLCPPSDSLDALYCRYQVIPVFGNSGDGFREPGTAVLIRKDIIVAEQFAVPGSANVTGGTSKSACAVCLQLMDMRMWCVSIHTTWGGTAEAVQKRLHHLRLVHEAMAIRLPSDVVIIGGDFNCSERDPKFADITSCDLVADLKRVQIPGCTITHAGGESAF
jgi:endonuclease/exonuclease/phosphatase family metal-dependent hydrolase